LLFPQLAQALMQGQRFIERRDDRESHGASAGLEREVGITVSSMAFCSKTRDTILYGLEIE